MHCMQNSVCWQLGGAIGDCLFFFCSGFTLFLGRERTFGNYYKRRINRIYPTVFMWALVMCMVFDKHNDMADIIVNGGGWFVTCIMIYYVILFFVRKYAFNHLIVVLSVAMLCSFVWYLAMDRPADFNMYGATYFKWCHFFSFMLLGAMLGAKRGTVKLSGKTDACMLVASTIAFYAILFAGRKWAFVGEMQVLSLLPLLAVSFYFYKVCNSSTMQRLYGSKWAGAVMKTISGLCLEVYVVQTDLFTDRMNALFPLNLLLMFMIILLAAYFLRCLSRCFLQTFKDMDYNWREVFKVY